MQNSKIRGKHSFVISNTKTMIDKMLFYPTRYQLCLTFPWLFTSSSFAQDSECSSKAKIIQENRRYLLLLQMANLCLSSVQCSICISCCCSNERELRTKKGIETQTSASEKVEPGGRQTSYRFIYHKKFFQQWFLIF